MIHPKLDVGEKLVVALKDHWITLVLPVFIYLIGTVISVLMIGAGITIFADQEIVKWIFILVGITNAILFHHWLFIYLLEHQMKVWIVTNKRVITFKFLPYVKHDVSFVMISELHEIDKHKHGLIQNILNYGEIRINLAASSIPVIFTHVPRPSAFVNLLETLHKTPPDIMDIERLRTNFYK